ncbi:hypothetical protein HDV62DRAFT_348345 [Trichoderma sp. SZMC 28011]
MNSIATLALKIFFNYSFFRLHFFLLLLFKKRSLKYLNLQLHRIYHGFLLFFLPLHLHLLLMPNFSCTIANTIPLLLFNPWSVSLSPCH